jgi:DNA-binding NtrC family response regulator
MAVEATLTEAGIPVAGSFASCADALAWTERNSPSVAILDYRLKDGVCTDLAKALLARDVPVIIYSGVPHGRETPPELHQAMWLEKPIAFDDLLQAVRMLAPSLASRALSPAA